MNVISVPKPFAPMAAPEIASGNANGGGFADAISAAISRVESSGASAQTAAADLLAGGTIDVPAVALIAQRAELSLELFQQVRNKFVSAYQEIMKMPM